MGDSVQADSWQRPQFSTTPVLKNAYFLFGMYRSKTLTMELDCHMTAHFALPAWCLAKAIKYVLLYSVSDQNLHLGYSKFYFPHKKMFSITRFQYMISQSPDFFPQWHRATSSFNIWQHTYEDRQLSNSPCFYPSPEFYSAPLQSLSLHCLQPFVCLFPPSFISQWPASFWAPQAAPLLMVAAYSLCAASVTSWWSELHWPFISSKIAAALSCHQHLLIQLVFSYNLTCNLFI